MKITHQQRSATTDEEEKHTLQSNETNFKGLSPPKHQVTMITLKPHQSPKKRLDPIVELPIINDVFETSKDEDNTPAKKRKTETDEEEKQTPPSNETNSNGLSPPKHQVTMITLKPHQSPKKRLDVSVAPNRQRDKFIYGNYDKYYGYRNTKDYRDIRLDIFEEVRDLFCNKIILDIGCNSGFITIEIAKKFAVKHITGIDIDKGLINRVNKIICKSKKSAVAPNQRSVTDEFPFNVTFVHGNYVLRNDVLLEIETEQFDLILCLSVTKWIHLNFGDAGLKQAFRRMFLQLRPGGKLILEAQPWDGYKRRKKLTPEIFANYQSIRFKPQDFTAFLLSSEVGFKDSALLAVPEHCAQGFRRPIQIFSKENK